MFHLKPHYVTDAKDKKVAVQLSIEAYEKIEEVLENYALFHLMKEAEEKPLNAEEAKVYYRKLKKKK
ncbi:MAG: hypothetical protein IPP77_14010 [Bacteroidetes bacterium]|nr:hypothetical protein [Bacteroidota bacterium]